ncbi:hypothetical protein [Aurantiacibacter rhizosphaerae]|uniref:Uncharacterized protein n=1 Tax=Aurantiacibacter rhizosphaerae TaxID=2691582 RepID=A0A844X9C1_9SPHN|nr:hypothetical protein [Aurantiacibacter rhizosphaerae]MWV26389.1 hypothetical protein [Aurantiacibacter rhizosphaerae]
MGYESKTFSLTIAEMREFAGFAEHEQRFIERSLDIALARNDAFKSWSGSPADQRAIRGQYLAYRELRQLRGMIPAGDGFDGLEGLMGPLMRISAQDIALEQIDCFSAYRFLYERLLGAAVRPFLPAAFCAAAALPQIRPERRRMLLQSLSEAAATAPAWSGKEPAFYPEKVEVEAA